jgi:hypothetical protein
MAKHLLFLFFILLAFTAKAQQQTYYWEGYFLSEQEKFEENQKSLDSNGYRINPEALDSGQLLLEVEDLRQFAQVFRKCRSNIEFQAEDGSTLQLSKRKVYRQIKQQFREETYGQALSKKSVRKLLRGKKKSRRAYPVPFYLDFGKVDSLSDEVYSFNFSIGRNSLFLLAFNPLLVEPTGELPHMRFSTCVPFERFTNFKSYYNRKYGNSAPITYEPVKELKRIRTFRLTFEKNKTTLAPEDELQIRQFMEDTTYIIKKAKVKAWASIEGSKELNERLHQRRAENLIRMLSAYSEEEIPYTVQTEENWPLFFDQLEAQRTDTSMYSRQEWKKVVAGDSIKWEPLLKRQRKAELKLYVIVQLDPIMRRNMALDRLRKMERIFSSGKNTERATQEMLAVFDYLQKEVQEEKLSASEFNMLLHSNGFSGN